MKDTSAHQGTIASGAMAETKTPEVTESEAERVARWRLRMLIEAGVPLAVAERVADHPEIEYQHYLTMVEQGCDPGLAYDILRA